MKVTHADCTGKQSVRHGLSWWSLDTSRYAAEWDGCITLIPQLLFMSTFSKASILVKKLIATHANWCHTFQRWRKNLASSGGRSGPVVAFAERKQNYNNSWTRQLQPMSPMHSVNQSQTHLLNIHWAGTNKQGKIFISVSKLSVSSTCSQNIWKSTLWPLHPQYATTDMVMLYLCQICESSTTWCTIQCTVNILMAAAGERHTLLKWKMTMVSKIK